MNLDNRNSNFCCWVVAFYAVLWLLFLTHFSLDFWVFIAIPVTLTYCGFFTYTMLFHGKIGTSADFPALPAALLAMLLICAVVVKVGLVEFSPEFVVNVISRFSTAWIGSHIILLLIAIIAENLGLD